MQAKRQVNRLISGMVKKIAAEYAPERVILFGSHASGSAGPDSDIDLLIIKDTAERFIDRLTAVRRILSDAKRTIPLEIIVLTPGELADRLAKGDQFIAEIIENGRILYPTETPVYGMHIPCKSPIYALSKSDEPVAKVRPGERFTVDLHDCFGGGIKSERDKYGPQYWGTVNPATGPIYIASAAKGDILAVHIHRISVSDTGVMIVVPKMGAVGDWIRKTETRILDIRDGCVIFGELKVPINPMIGVIGTAPKGSPVPTGKPGEHGGNMDCKLISAGSTLYLPVNTEGALLSMGDIHAVMGDGEVCVTGVECSGTVELETSILRNTSLPTPVVETDDVIATIASHADLDTAAHNATRKMLDLLQTRFGMRRNEAAMWMSAFADLRICQVVNPLKTCRMEAPKRLLSTGMALSIRP